MKELIDLKKIWDWCVSKWKTSFATVVIALVAFLCGMALEEKMTVDDCKFMGSFRDGTQAYSCQPRVR